jgi:hypothetical protein
LFGVQRRIKDARLEDEKDLTGKFREKLMPGLIRASGFRAPFCMESL